MAIQMTPEEIEEIFREYNEAVIRGLPIEEELAERMRDATLGLKNYTFELRNSLEGLKSSSIGLARALKNGESGASIYNNTIESGADALSVFLERFGPLGKAIGVVTVGLSKLVSAVNQQNDALFQGYQDLARFGAGVTTGLDGVLAMSQQMGYTVEQLGEFAGMLERSAPELALLGGTVAGGSARFAQLVKDVSGQREMWRQLGLDVAQQNEAYSGFIRIMTISGRAQRMTGNELAAASQTYLYNLLTLSKLTGETVEELNKQREGFMAQQRFASVQRDLEKRAREADERGDVAEAARLRNMAERNFLVLQSVPEELRTGVADAMTGFLGTSDASIQLLRSMPEFAQMLASQNFEYSEAMGVADREAAAVLNNFSVLAAAGGFDETFGSAIGFMKIESAALNMSMQQRIQAAKDAIAAQKAQTGAVADQAKMREAQLQTAQNLQSLVSIFQGPVASAMRGLAQITGEATTALTGIADINQRGAAPGAGAGTTNPPAPANMSTMQFLLTPGRDIINRQNAQQPTEATTARRSRRAEPAAPVAAPALTTPEIPATAPAAAAVIPMIPLQSATPASVNINLPELPAYAQGGIATGPTSGYQAMLTGVNAVVPLGGGRSIPVKMPDMSLNMNEQMNLMTQQMLLLDDLVRETRSNNSLTERLLKVARS